MNRRRFFKLGFRAAMASMLAPFIPKLEMKLAQQEQQMSLELVNEAQRKLYGGVLLPSPRRHYREYLSPEPEFAGWISYSIKYKAHYPPEFVAALKANHPFVKEENASK